MNISDFIHPIAFPAVVLAAMLFLIYGALKLYNLIQNKSKKETNQ